MYSINALSSVSIIVPTYHEVESLPHLISRLNRFATEFSAFELIVVDDDSRDGTEALVERLALPWVRLVVRKASRDLSRAVVDGLRLARHETIVVMDADLSHPPEMIPQMVSQAASHDFVVGSRYVEGGIVDEGWTAYRWINSKIATLLALPFTRMKDPMSGFLAFRRDRLDHAAPLDPIGYKIGLELIVKCNVREVLEIPIRFRDRQYGQSKLSIRQQVLYLRHIGRLATFRIRRRRR